MDTPLHCYLYHDHHTQRKQRPKHHEALFLSAVTFLVEQHAAALRKPNRHGWLPLHVAALQNVPLDVVFYLARQNPESLLLFDTF